MNTPKTAARTQPSFAAVLAAHSKLDRITQLQAALDRVMEENFELKNHLYKLEERFNSMVDLTTDKVKEVEAKVSQAHSETITQVKTFVTKELYERRLQEENALKVHIGRLPLQWCTIEDTLEEAITKLNDILQPVNIKPEIVAWINDTHRHVRPEHCILTFKDKDERLKFLCQSHLLKGTMLWITKELTTNRLKIKKDELKKMSEARKQSKWAVYRGGKTIIQEFRTSKGALPSTTRP
ncbi:hypothetical protein GOP47_0020387 [Adiantum capillus-veneris]|uniref:Uncharacterized protein n=1 Tax=Adiantum capillus-veneris TaxID=13818 RepID=A0A9D4Z9I5_ADICA|nr:hypothetical protein GOP47_0020387 [Adiantum capillus-veneris]